MRPYARSFAAWLATVALGPACPFGCGYRARGPRSSTKHETRCRKADLAAHARIDHAGDPAPTTRSPR